MMGVAWVIVAICRFSVAASVEMRVDENGALSSLGRITGANSLAEPLRMRILERRFYQQNAADGPGETDRSVVVANQDAIFDEGPQSASKHEPRLVIDDVKVKPGRVSRMGESVSVTRSDPKTDLSWSTVFSPGHNALEIAVTFKNQGDRLRSLDVEFPLILSGADYNAFFPGCNDFPEWPEDSALGYQLRAGQSDYNNLSQPLATFYSKPRDVGLSVASSYRRPILPITFFAARSKGNTAVLATFVRVRLDPGGERTVRLYLIPHAGDWRSGLAFVRNAFPNTFYVNPEVSKFFTRNFGGSGTLGGYYPECLTNPRMWKNYQQPFDPWRRSVIEMMGLGRWQGFYMSDISEWTPMASEKWYFVNNAPGWFPEEFLEGKPAENASWQEIVAWIESRPEHLKGQIFKKGQREGATSRKYAWQKVTKSKVCEFIRVAKEHNTAMFLYWNPRDVWYPYARDRFEDLIVYRSRNYFNFDCAYVSAPKGSTFFSWHLDQIRRMFAEYPRLDGFFVDQCYATAGHVYTHDDGYTVTDDGRAASCFNSNLAELTAAGRKIAHKHGKFVWGNHAHEIIDIVANYDLALIEGRMRPGTPQETGRYASIGNRPWIALGVDERIQQVSLRDGGWQCAWTQNDHDDYETRMMSAPWYWGPRLYAPMFDLFRSRTWVLEPHCLRLPSGFEGNLFRIDGEENLLATVVAFGESFMTPWLRLDVPVTIRTTDAVNVKAAYVVGAANLGVFKVPFERDGHTITVKIPQFRGSAAVLLAKKGRFVSVETSLPMTSAGGTYAFDLVADNLTDETWSWKNTVWLGHKREWHWEETPAGESVTKPFHVTVPGDTEKPFTQMKLAKDVESRLPIEDGGKNHMATFEFFVQPPVSATLSPSRALVERTLSNTGQGGYKPFYAVHPLHVYDGEMAEFTLGIMNNTSSTKTLAVEINGGNVTISDVPGSVKMGPMSQRNVAVVVRGAGCGASSLHVDIKDGNKVVSTFDLPIQVFGTSLAEADMGGVKRVSLLYDLWGRTKTNGSEAKAIHLNGVDVGPLVSGGAYPVWYSRTRAELNEAAVQALEVDNEVSITNPGSTFWKIRNVVLEITLSDGSTVHLKAEPGAISFPANHFRAEGKCLDANTPFEFRM